jgi:hypothetical protein
MSGSLTNLLTASQNIVTALNNQAQTSLEIEGLKNATGITTATLVSAVPGRVARISVTIAGTGSATIYDASSIATATGGRIMAVVTNTVGVYVINMPVTYGIVVVPGSGMTVAISYS